MKLHLAIASVLLLCNLSDQEERRPTSRSEGEEGTEQRKDSDYKIAVAKLKRMAGTVTSFQDLANKLKVNLQNFPKHKKTVKIAGGGGSQVVDTTPNKIYCHIRSLCVDIAQPRDGSGIHWPFCAIVPRCSGCCDLSSSLMSCQPIKKSNQSVEVMYISYSLIANQGAVSSRSSRSAAGQNSFMRRVLETVEVHEQCGCNCRLSPSSCNAKQRFDWETCGCECNATQKCSSSFKWNKDECECKCNRPRRICPTRAYEWSEDACKCVCRTKTTCGPLKQFNEQKCICENAPVVNIFKKFKNQG